VSQRLKVNWEREGGHRTSLWTDCSADKREPRKSGERSTPKKKKGKGGEERGIYRCRDGGLEGENREIVKNFFNLKNGERT